MTTFSARLFAVALLLAAEGAVTVTFAANLPENIPDFSQDTSRPAVQSVQSGSWSNPSTWGGAVPTANHVVRIVLGHTVTIDDTSAVAYTIAVDGKLAFAPTVNTRLKVTNLEVMAGEMGMGTPRRPGSGHRGRPDRRQCDGRNRHRRIRRSAAASRTRSSSARGSSSSARCRCTAA